MELENTLMACAQCNIVLQYYDFLSHTNYCSMDNENAQNIHSNSDMETEIDADDADEEDNTNDMNMFSNSGMNSMNGLNDYANYLGNYNQQQQQQYNQYNLATSPISNNLYNPMINRGFHIDNLTNSISHLTLNCVLDKTQLLKHSKKIECSERTDCPICLCSYSENTTFYLMYCNHSFCIECCEKWFFSNSCCPLCRMNYK
jgi:hypothetical protein